MSESRGRNCLRANRTEHPTPVKKSHYRQASTFYLETDIWSLTSQQATYAARGIVVNKALIAILLFFCSLSFAVELPIAPGMTTSSVTSQTEVNGMKMRIIRFETKQSSDQVINYYNQFWNGEGVISPLPP